jgi:hypothetical protein
MLFVPYAYWQGLQGIASSLFLVQQDIVCPILDCKLDSIALACRCSENSKLKLEEVKASHTLGGLVERGNKEGEVDKRRDVC